MSFTNPTLSTIFAHQITTTYAPITKSLGDVTHFRRKYDLYSTNKPTSLTFEIGLVAGNGLACLIRHQKEEGSKQHKHYTTQC
jgi:hypothetical protein